MDQKTLVFLLIACLLCVSSSAALSMILTSGEDESTPEDENTPGSVPSPSTSDRINAAVARREAEEDEPSVTMESGGTSIKTSSDENNDCTGAWGDWGDCTQECSYEGSKGEKVRMYSVEWPATGEGKACPYDDGEEEVQECGKIACTPKNCVGNWTAWSVEGVGANAIEKRSWDVTQEPKYGGDECSVEESARIETKAATASTPSVDCVGSWVNVGMCSETCGPNGTQKRRYDVTTAASGPDGKSCMDSVGLLLKDGDIDNTQPCNTDIVCPVNCVGSYGNWSSCSETCGPGTKRRTYSVTTPAAGTGTACAKDDGYEETADCEDKPCDVNCDGHWTIAESDVRTTGVSKIKWKQTQAKTGNGADCKATFIKNGKRNEWEDQIVNDGDWAEHIYGDDGLLQKRDVRNHIQNEFGTPNKTGDQYIYCVRRPNTTGTASRWPQGHPAYKSWEYNLCDNDG